MKAFFCNFLPSFLCLLTGSFILCHGVWGGNVSGKDDYALSIERLSPFDTTGLKPGVASVLRAFYERTYTDADTWAAIESFRFIGALHFSEAAVEFTVFKKKPNLMKVVLKTPNGHRVTMGYDGREAWQLKTQESALAKKMPPMEARNFIRDSPTGSHLLYPRMEGKSIELVGTTTIDDARAYELRITLPDGQVIRSFLDMTSFAEVRQVSTNQVTGVEEVTKYENFRIFEGIRVPFTSTRLIDGVEIHQSRIEEVRVNEGVTPWIFRRPPMKRLIDEPRSSGSTDPNGINGAGGITPPPSFFDIDI
jgi:hypothetical protein